MSEFFAIFLFTTLGGMLAGLAYSYIGGTGVTRDHRRRIAYLEDEVENLSSRLTSEIRRRAAHTSQEARAAGETVKEEAQRRLREQGQSEPADVLPFQSFSNYIKPSA